MGDLVITILIFVGVMAVTAIVFGGWLIAWIVGFIVRVLTGNPAPVAREMGPRPMCRNEQCRAINPAGANYCRRCGRAIAMPKRVPVQRAAMW